MFHSPARFVSATAVAAALAVGAVAFAGAERSHTSRPFHGPKVNRGTVTHSVVDGRDRLTLSGDFQVPDAPAPHWRLIDGDGQAYLLQRLDIKGDKVNRAIVVPAHIPDIQIVQIWCAWAETVLGETTFGSAIRLAGPPRGVTETHVSSRFSGSKANRGTVTHLHGGRLCTLTLSEDFIVPDAPAPHWQIVDSRGNAYLLERLMVKSDGNKERLHRTIVVPAYVTDVARVQIWCAWAETLLGEASFERPIR